MSMSTPQDLQSNLIELLASRSLGLSLIALVADLIAADARFNHWIAFKGKRTLSEAAMLQSIDMYEDTADKCLTEIEKFAAMQDIGSLETVLSEALEALKRSTGR